MGILHRTQLLGNIRGMISFLRRLESDLNTYTDRDVSWDKIVSIVPKSVQTRRHGAVVSPFGDPPTSLRYRGRVSIAGPADSRRRHAIA